MIVSLRPDACQLSPSSSPSQEFKNVILSPLHHPINKSSEVLPPLHKCQLSFFVICFLALSFTLSHWLSHALSLSLSLIGSLTLSLSLFHSLSLAHSLSLSSSVSGAQKIQSKEDRPSGSGEKGMKLPSKKERI